MVCHIDYLSLFLPSTLKNGKVFVFLAKLCKRVFHPNVFSHMVKSLSLWGWEGDWSPTGHQLVALPYFMCGDWSHCMMHCLSIVD